VSRRTFVVVALLALALLLCLDCLNVVQSESWPDLSRAPHMAAITRNLNDGAQDLAASVTHGSGAFAVVPAPIDRFVVTLLWVLMLGVATIRFARPPFRRRLRGPPACRFSASLLPRRSNRRVCHATSPVVGAA
jgi:hypothetical protein